MTVLDRIFFSLTLRLAHARHPERRARFLRACQQMDAVLAAAADPTVML